MDFLGTLTQGCFGSGTYMISLNTDSGAMKTYKEANGFALYNKALGLQRTGNHRDAENVFHQLLNSHLLINAALPEDPEKPGGLVQPGQILKYSTYKNLGSIAFQRHDLSTAMEHYLEAASLDSTDVTLWFKIGTVALELHHLPLARVAFQQGLTCNQKHWPCLDQLCTVLYALNDYATCLYYVCKALERDHAYTKGLALRDQIFSEQPSFRKDSYHMFRHCHDSIHNAKVKKEDAEKVIKEALTLRDKKRALQVKPDSPVLKFRTPLRKFTWKDLGEQFIALYDHISERVPKLSMGCTIDITGSLQETANDEHCQQVDSPMEVDSTKPTPSVTTQGTLPPAQSDGGGTEPFVPAESAAMALPSPGVAFSNQVNAASNVPGLSQGQEQVDKSQEHEDGIQHTAQPAVEKGLDDADDVQQITDGQQEVDQIMHNQHQQQLQEGQGQQQQQEQGQQQQQEQGQQQQQEQGQQQQQSSQQQSQLTLQQIHSVMEESAAASGDQSSAMEDDTVSQATLVAMETDETREGKQKKRRGPKRKRGGFELDEMYGGKRRSARVRNTTKKKEVASVNYAELLQRFLPSSLTDSETDDDSQDGLVNQEEPTPDAATPVQQPQDKPCEFDTTEFLITEEVDVKQFLEEHEDNSGILDLMHYFLVVLAKKFNLKWPYKLTDVFLKIFERLRKHCCFPEILSSDASEQYRRGVGEMLLVYAELKVDQWFAVRAKTSGTPKKSSSSSPADSLANFPGQFFEEDMGYIEDMAYLPVIAGETWRTYAVRANWMKSCFLILDGKPEMSVDFFDQCTSLLTSEKSESDENKTPMTVVLPNCIQHYIITKAKIEEQKKSLERCQSLEEVQRLHGDEDYKQVVKLLLPTVMQPSVARGGKPVAETSAVVPERRSQLELLFEALLKLQDYSKCIVCGAASLAETWQEFMSAKSGNTREEWTGLLIQILETLDKALSEDISVVGQVERSRLVQLTSTLISIIEYAMEGAEMESTQPLTTVLPWILLYRLIKIQEDKLTKMRISTGSPARSGSPVPMMSSSLMLLETAHEYLGRHSWCCNSDGALLKLYISVLKTEVDKTSDENWHPFADDLQLAVEQCFYCLYAHPNRRSKARHLQDHGVEEVPLQWEYAGFLFDYFKPKLVPEFDSYKANSMSADLESLFLKISKIIPEEENPVNSMEAVQAYMEGNSEKTPSLPQDRQDDRPVVKEIHYFLADFYFKNKEFGKAIKFYILDICVCPNRLDSWAGVALARGGRLDLKLNSCDSKTESPIYKNSVSALRCFKRALEIDETNLSLWIEYGSLAYTLHSHASRQLKQHIHLRLSDETKELLRDKRKEMLELAGHCFLKASECEGDGDGEEWLVQYMLGKVSEKRHTDPGIYLGHYLEAAHHLFENEAKYPKKITYHNPPDLSLEALEMYYRLHASILKLLARKGAESVPDYGVLNEFVQKAADTPFVKAKEKKNSDQSDLSEIDSDGKSSSGQRSRLSSSGCTSGTPIPMSPAYMTPQDHDYIKKKSKKKRNVSLETLSTETASEGEALSGDDSSLSQSAAAVQLLKSLAEMKYQDGGTTTTTATETSASEAEGGHTETESSSQDESPLGEPKVRVKIDEDVHKSKRSSVPTTSVAKAEETDATKVTIQGLDSDKIDSAKSSAPIPMGIIKVNPEESTVLNMAKRSEQGEEAESDSEPEIIDLISDSESPVVKPKLAKVAAGGKKYAGKKSERKVASENKEQVASASSGNKEDVSFIDLTVDSSDSEGVASTPPRRALHESPIKARPPSNKDGDKLGMSGKEKEDASGIKKQERSGGDEPMEVDGTNKSEEQEDSLKTKGESEKEKPMEVDAKQTAADKSNKPATETTSGPACERANLIDGCINALGLCLSRFPQHYKSLYRLTQVYCSLDTHKNLQWSRDLLLGTLSTWQHESHMPAPALFGEHSKTKNLFQGIWRIPITEIDRSGSFTWHMYRSVLLLLEVLELLQDHQMLLQVAIKLSKMPEQGKKYLRDMDRQYLCQQSYQLCLAVLQQQLSEAKESNDEEKTLGALMAAHKVWQCVQSGKLQVDAGVPANILRDAYKAYKGAQVESEPSVLEQAVRFCAYYNMVNKIPQTPTSSYSDVLFPGRSPKDSWCGSPVRASKSETMFNLSSPTSFHDNKTTPSFPITTPPMKSIDGAASQDGRKMNTSVGFRDSGSKTDFQAAYKESILHKSKDISKSAVKPRVGSPTSLPLSTKAAAGFDRLRMSIQPKVSTQGKVPATQARETAGVKISAVTGKPIIKLRTLSSMGIKVKPSGSEQTTSKLEQTTSKSSTSGKDTEHKSQSKYFESTSKGQYSMSTSIEGSSTKPHQAVVSSASTSSASVSSAYAGSKLYASAHSKVTHPGQPMLSQPHPAKTKASATVVQKLREALGTKKLEAKDKLFASKLSLHTKHAGESSSHSTSKLSLHREQAKHAGEISTHSSSKLSLHREQAKHAGEISTHSSSKLSLQKQQGKHAGESSSQSMSKLSLHKEQAKHAGEISTHNTSKLSLHREHAKHTGESSAHSTSKLSLHREHAVKSSIHGNIPPSSSAVQVSSIRGAQLSSSASMPSYSHGQSQPGSSSSRPASSVGQGPSRPDPQHKEDPSKESDSKSNFMSAFLSFVGGGSK